MERESPRAGQGARAGKSIAADGHGHSKTSKAKPPERKAGRRCGDAIGFPVGCVGDKPDALAECSAGLRRRQCLACIRTGAWPMPQEWQRGAMNIIGNPHVQALWSARDGVWRVVVFLGGFMVDGRFPVIACTTRNEATELAHVRARQLEPYAPLEQRGRDDWRCGRVLVWVTGNGR